MRENHPEFSLGKYCDVFSMKVFQRYDTAYKPKKIKDDIDEVAKDADKSEEKKAMKTRKQKPRRTYKV